MSALVSAHTRFARRIDGSDMEIRSELRVHMRGEASEYWSITSYRDGVRGRVNIGRREYIQRLWGSSLKALLEAA